MLAVLAEPPVRLSPQVVAPLVAVMSGVVLGLTTHTLATLLAPMAAEWELSPTQVGALQTAQVTGALIGCTFGGWLADVLGRRKMAMIASVAVCVLAVHMLFVQSYVHFLVARFLQGFPHAFIFCIIPPYVAEISPAEKRGRNGVTYGTCIALGACIMYGVGFLAEGIERPYRVSFGLLSVVAAMYAVVVIVAMPESPRWLKQKQRERAFADGQTTGSAYARVQTEHNEEDGHDGEQEGEGEEEEAFVDENDLANVPLHRSKPPPPPPIQSMSSELSLLSSTGALLPPHEHEQQQEQQPDTERPMTLLELFRDHKRAWMIAVLLVCGNQLNGSIAVLFYGPLVFREGGFQPVAATMSVGVWMVVTNFLCAALVERIGRRPLYLAGVFGCFVTTAVIASAFAFLEGEARSILVVVGIFIFHLFVNLGPGPLFLTIVSEVFPQQARARATSVSLTMMYGLIVLITFAFPPVTAAIGSGAVFFIFSACCLATFFALYKVLKETKGKELEAIKA